MVTAVHAVSYVSSGDLRMLVGEVRKHGPGAVFDNRVNRAEMLRQQGDEEFAQRAEREAGYILDVLV